MYLVRQFRINKRKSEQGFILIAALFAMLILMAVGAFALTMTTQDIRTSGRYLCERRSFSAADAGITELCLAFDPNILVPVSNVQVDSANDPSSKYSYAKPTRNSMTPKIDALRSDLAVGKKWIYELYNGSVTGMGGGFGCEVNFDVGLKYGPVSDDSGYQ